MGGKIRKVGGKITPAIFPPPAQLGIGPKSRRVVSNVRLPLWLNLVRNTLIRTLRLVQRQTYLAMEPGYEETIDPPPDHTYGSYEEAHNALKTHGMQHCYGFYIHRRRPHDSDVKTRYYFQCDKSRTYQSKATVRSTSTRTTGCPFRLVIFKMKREDDQQMNDQWTLEVSSSFDPSSLVTQPHWEIS